MISHEILEGAARAAAPVTVRFDPYKSTDYGFGVWRIGLIECATLKAAREIYEAAMLQEGFKLKG